MTIDRSRLSARDRVLFWLWRCTSEVWDPLHTLTGMREIPRFLRSWRSYLQMPGAEAIQIADIYPQLHDRTTKHSIDAHYFYANAWGFRRILAANPREHVDIASQPVLASLLSALIPVSFVDYRRLPASLDGLTCVEGNILRLPYDDGSVESLSCLHVAEHIGLGRYGDHLEPRGTYLACREMARVLAPNGNLLFAVPVGKPKLCFNAHRIHAAETIRDYFFDLEMIEFSAVRDDGTLAERIDLSACRGSAYACGLFWFRAPQRNTTPSRSASSG